MGVDLNGNICEERKELEGEGLKQEIDNSKHPPVNRIVLTEKGVTAARKLKELEEILKG